jgi:hypothetical protein
VDDLGSLGAIAGGVAAVIAGLLLAAFFATGRESLGHANDAAGAVMAILLMPAALSVVRLYAGTGPFILLVTAIGLVAMIVAAVASVLTAAGRLTVTQLTVWQGGSFVALFLWVAGTSVSILVWGRLPVGLGWLGLVAALLVLVAIGEILGLARRMGGLKELVRLDRPPLLAAATMLTAFVAFPVWCVWLGMSLSEVSTVRVLLALSIYGGSASR